MSAPRRLAVPPLDHDVKPEALGQRLDAAIAACDRALAEVVAVPDAQHRFANTVEAIEQSVATFSDATMRLGILKEIHTNPDVRNAAAEVEERAGQYGVLIGARRDLYQAVKEYLANAGKTESLEPEQKRLLELMLRDFRRNGLELPDDKLKRLVEIRQRLTTLATEFQRHLNENEDQIVITAAETEGLPPSFVERLKKTEDGKHILTMKYPDYVPFMENAKDGNARHRAFITFNRREADRNAPILEEAINLREQAAKLLGYATHADFVTEDRMAKNAERVSSFLTSLGQKLSPRRDADYATLTQLKREETGNASDKLQPWDLSYFLNKWKKRDFELDTETIREFFPSDHVLREMFGVYETLLSIRLQEVADAHVWAPGVKLYEVRDRETNELFAHFYTDLHPRAGKYGHAAVAPFTVPRQVGDGYHEPIVVLLANFTPPSAERPSLLTHEEVKTLFHEFGHVMHQALTRARYGSQAGFNVAGDFVEAPSQMLENWVYTPEVLDRLSAHYQDPKRKLPHHLIQKMEAARFYDAGYRYTRQVYLARFDQKLHTSGATVKVREVEHALYREIMGLEPVAETNFAASFGHLMGGYDAGYYGYLWSEVFAADMFTLFEQQGVLNTTLGRRYRDTILAKGRSIEADALLEEFLGRPANNEAFLKKLDVA
jgi:thimet oligopeptidase